MTGYGCAADPRVSAIEPKLPYNVAFQRDLAVHCRAKFPTENTLLCDF